MKLTDIAKRRKGLVALTFDCLPDREFFGYDTDSTGRPVIDAAVCEENSLAVGTELTDGEFSALIRASFYRRAKSRALWYLSRSDLSRKALTGKLKRAFPEDVCAEVCDKMEEYGYLNDTRYAELLAERLVNGKKVASGRAVAEMAAKGIDISTAKAALDGVESDPVAVICELIEKKYKSRMSDPDGVKKTVAALARRGFSFHDIKEAVGKYNKETELYED